MYVLLFKDIITSIVLGILITSQKNIQTIKLPQ